MHRRIFITGLTVALAGCLGEISDDFDPVGPPDDARFEFDGDNRNGVTITYAGGEAFAGEHMAIRGPATMGATPRTMGEATIEPGDEIHITWTHISAGDLSLVWIGDGDETEMAEWTVPQ